MTTFSTYTFGCRLNQAETQIIEKKMIRSGFKQVEHNPDLFIINSCAVTHKAEREARQLINKLKRENPKLKVVITGCSATYWEKNKTPPDNIDLLINNHKKLDIVEIIKKTFKFNLQKNTTFKILDKYISSKRAILKIQDGCHRFCSYCIVPYLRGLPRSPKISRIIKEVKAIENSISEVIYTAINTEDFGKENNETLIDLIRDTLNKTKIKRISFGSIHPWSITEEFLRYYKDNLADNDRFVDFFHIPLQSGSNRVLDLMKRGYTREEWLPKLKQLRKINKRALLATDVIVGFLDETEEDFRQTYNFLEKSPIVKFHVFRFSPRKSTAAYYLQNRLKKVEDKVKKERSMFLRKLGEKKYKNFLTTLIGESFQSLVLNKKIAKRYIGLLNNQIPVLLNTNKNVKPGDIVQVSVKDFNKKYLIAKTDV